MKKIRELIRKHRRKTWTRLALRYYERRDLRAIPTQLGLCLTHLCNLKCTYCMRETYVPSPGRITLKQIKNLMPKMPYISGVCIMGLCEPLLNPETPDIINWLKTEGEYGISLTTNGMVNITPSILESLKHVDDMVFSIDSPNHETTKTLRGGADLGMIMKNLDVVLDYKRDNGLGVSDNPPIHINAVMTRETFPQFPELVELFEPYAEELTYLMVDPVSRPDYSEFSPFTTDQTMRSKLTEYRKIARKSCLKVMGLDWMFESSLEWGRCCLAWTGMFVHPNGDAYFCYDYKNVLGNVFKEKPLEVWNSPRAKDFRRLLDTVGPPLIQCHFCNFARPGWQLEGNYQKKKEDVIG